LIIPSSGILFEKSFTGTKEQINMYMRWEHNKGSTFDNKNFFSSAEDGTQGCTHARQALYH
jgi:hypothetical protein